jgi:hypothetical protein
MGMKKDIRPTRKKKWTTSTAAGAVAIAMMSTGWSTQVRADDTHAEASAPAHPEHSHSASDTYSEPLGFSLTKGWLDPWPHKHFSRRGTPFVHLFFTEPAYLDRDFFLDTRIAHGNEGDEVEIEAEIEWALTRRIGLVLEVPYLLVDPKEGKSEEGLGDIAVAPRFLLAETDRFLLSANLEVELPTGSARRGLGSGETALSPTLSLWYDLGKFVAFNAQFGTEHGLKSGEKEFLYKTVLTYSLLDAGMIAAVRRTFASHFPPGMANLLLEVTGRTGLSHEERGRTSAEALFGATYLVTGHVELRAGIQFPLFKPKEFDNAYILSLVYHF